MNNQFLICEFCIYILIILYKLQQSTTEYSKILQIMQQNEQYTQIYQTQLKKNMQKQRTNKCIILLVISLYVYFLQYTIRKQFYNQQTHQYTIIIADQYQYNYQKLQNIMKQLYNQTFQNWNLIYYTNKIQKQLQNIQKLIKQFGFQQKVNILQSYSNVGMNFYDAFNNQCKLNTIGIIMNIDDKFGNQSSLQNIVNYFQNNNNVYIMAVGVSNNGNYFPPQENIKKFKRYNYQSQQDKKYIYNNVTTHVRVFKTDFFRDLYPFDFLNIQDQFYNNRISFLFPLLQIYTYCPMCIQENDNKYKNLKINSQIAIFNESIFNINNIIHQYDKQVQQIFSKHAYQSLIQKAQPKIQRSNQFGILQTWGQNIIPGKYNLLKRNISKNIKRIPKNIHQFWINKNSMPPLRKKLSQIAKQKYHDYKYRLWGLQDITKQNFPRTYETIMKLIQYDKISPISRMSMVADLMRLQVIYNQGGFHVDLNYQVFKTYQQFRHYQLVVGVQLQFQIPKAASMGTWGAQKGSKFINQLLTQKYLNKINISGPANFQTGPHFLGQVITMQDMYYRVKYIPAQLYLPYFYWSHDPRFQNCKCRFSGQIPQQIKGTYNSTEFIKGMTTIIPCQNRYPKTVYGIDHLYNGYSWIKKTQ